MPQVTLYLDNDTERLMREHAKAAGLPYSRWVATLIREKARTQWPEAVRQAAGQFPDFPLAEQALAALGADSERIGF